MKKQNNTRKIYEALGFVESMLAIMIVGISSVVLMQIAVDTMQGIIQNETIDEMTQYAIEGAEIVQDIANRNNEVGEDDDEIFPAIDDGQIENCFILVVEGGEFQFKEDDNGFLRFENDAGRVNREEYKDIAILDEQDHLFRWVCLDSPRGGVAGDSDFIMANVIVGQRASDGTITRGNLVKDYSYRTIIKL